MRRPFAGCAIAACTLLLGLLGGCSDDQEPAGDTIDTRLQAAKQKLDEAASIRFTMSTEKVPEGVTGIRQAAGVGTHAPAFKGDITLASGGFLDGQTIGVVAVGGKVYAQTPFASAYIPIDPADYGAPDPADLMNPKTGLTALFGEATGVTEEEQSRDGDTVVTNFSGSLPNRSIARIFPTVSGDRPFQITFAITDDDEVRSATITGPFYGDSGDVTYDVTFDPSDKAVEITKP